MNIAIIVVVVILLIVIIGVAIYMLSGPNWNGLYTSLHNPGVKFSIRVDGNKAIISDGNVGTVSGNTIIAFGTRGVLSGNKISWDNSNVWTKVA